ncbi:MAG: hypothetical protein R6W68_07700 [Ignavibacteriaceae bacterium]
MSTIIKNDAPIILEASLAIETPVKEKLKINATIIKKLLITKINVKYKLNLCRLNTVKMFCENVLK